MRSAASPFDESPTSTPRRLIWATVAMVLLSLPLLFNFLGRLQAEARMAAEVERRAEQVRKDEATLVQLREALEYARSDTFTERYAREQARYAKPGEVVVVPPGGEDTSQSRTAWWEDFVKLNDAASQSESAGDTQPIDHNP